MLRTIMQMQHTKNLNPGGFKLGTTLSEPIWSVEVIVWNKERVSIECRKTKTKVITLANQKGRRQSSKPIKT